MTKFRRLACVCLTAVMSVSLAASQTLAFANDSGDGSPVLDKVEFENVTGKMDFSSVVLNNLSQSVLENAGITTQEVTANTTYTVIVELSDESIIELADSAETVSEYISTYSGSRKLKSIRRSQENFLARLSAAGIGYKYLNSYTTVTNAVAVQVNSSDFKKIAKMDGVENVILSSTYAYPEAVSTASSADVTDNPSNVYETGIYKSEEIIEKYGVDGSGMTVAILDTGLDYAHDAFQTMPNEQTLGLTKQDVAELLATKNFDSDILYANGGKSLTADDVYINAKVPFAYDYADGDTDVYPAYSVHGTHVAGIVAGQADSYTDKNGETAKDAEGNVLSFRGVAPNAQLVICKVFTDDFDSEDLGGATTEDILAALDDCVNLGVDVINMSLGSASGFSSLVIDNEEKGLNDTEGKWMNDVYNSVKDKGISLICAASNEYSSGFGSAFGTNLASNPDSGTVGSPSTYDGAVSVASINGQLARYMTVETVQNNQTQVNPIYYLETSDENSVQYDFLGRMLKDGATQGRFKYVLVPGNGESADYTSAVQRELKDKSNGPVIAIINRGKSTFKDKIQLAMDMDADAAILVNNVSGTIRVSLGDLDDPIPAASVTMDAGIILTAAATNRVGYLTLDESYQAGPFMNDYSSWGVSPDLKLKPDITSHGGEITSTVPGGYDEQSGTSMASPNLAGFVALLRSYLKQQDNFKNLNSVQLNTLVNQILMSTAIIVYDQSILPYSPRKQGAGLASLDNSFSTNAYLYTQERVVDGVLYCEDGRPKYELGADTDKKGEYTITFYVNNFGTSDLTFSLNSIFMTETLSSDGLSVAEKAHLFGDNAAQWTVGSQSYNEGDTVTVKAGASDVKISVTLTLSDAEKRYLDTSFVNGMFVEGFISLKSQTEGQCDLSLPYLGFYGDWKAAPMLDYNCYEISDFEQDTSLLDDQRPQAQVWATQAYARYYNGQYNVPMGGFLYLQDENADQIYTEEEYASVSGFNEYYGLTEAQNYLTTYSIRALYAGLLRNAEVVRYNLYNDATGEYISGDYVYRVAKSISNGGSAIPSNVKLDLTPTELGLVSNGKYRLDFYFYFDADDVGDESAINEDNTFSMTFYVDYEAPILTDARVRYYDYKDGNKDRQRVYLDVDVYDNHYAQSVILCYINENKPTELVMATEYVTPVYNAVKNGVTTVSIEITEFYEKYKDSLYIQVDDYALNHSVYALRLSSSQSSSLPSTFEIADGSAITIGIKECHKLTLNYEGSASLSDFTWGTSNGRVRVKNGEIYGVSAGTSTVTVSNGTVTRRITVTVVDKGITLPYPNLSFGLIETATDGLHNAVGAVEVYAGRTYTLEVVPDPWYYPIEELELNWDSTNPEIASVDGNGNVTTHGKEGSATISARIGNTLYAATVTFNVRDPFTISNFSLTSYHGPGGYVVIPNDKNIMTIGEEAFQNDTTIEYVVIPKTVTQISKRAFQGCTNLKAVYFIQEEALAIPDAKVSVILEDAFEGCTSLELVDFNNIKVATLGRRAFANCTSLTTVNKMQAIGTMNEYAFANCTSLESADITGLHSAGTGVFLNCTSISSIKTDYYSSIGVAMFEGCTSLKGKITINTPIVSDGAFLGCTEITSVDFGGGAAQGTTLTFSIGAQAFDGCSKLETVTFGNHKLSSLGDRAFANCTLLKTLTLPEGNISFGDQVFYNTPVQLGSANLETDVYGAIYSGNTLVLAPKTITADFAFKSGVTEIGAFAFSNSTLSGVTSITVPETVTKIGEGAFAHLLAGSIVLPSKLNAIPDYAFYGCENVTSLTIPADVVTIGVSAFEGCVNLTQINFNGSVKEMGDNAFAYCQKLTSVALPSSVEVMGSYVFSNCHELVEVSLPALKSLGSYTFYACNKLARATFDPNATTVGMYTFFPGGDSEGIYPSALTSVTLPDALEAIGTGVFNYCGNLASIDLKHATSVGAYAFAGCGSLKTVTGLNNLESIGLYAFAETGLTALNLASAKSVGAYAFYNVKATSVTLSAVETIGTFAFFGGLESTIVLPASLRTFGAAAFAGCANLRSVNVAAENTLFFSEDGVLYRNVYNYSTGKTGYELAVYPAAKADASYNVKEGTVSVAAYAFAEMGDRLTTVVLPASLKTIGAAAFYNSGITDYVFESVTAPELLTEIYDNSFFESGFISGVTTLVNYFYTMYYTNFEFEFMPYSHVFDQSVREKSDLKITVPSNATGYDNYIYTQYFGTVEKGDEVMDETTAGFKEIMDELIAEYGDVAAAVKGWNSLEVNESNTATVQNFSDRVKLAHGLYNNIVGEVQFELLDEGKDSGYYYNLLTSIESELKSIKSKFGIAVSATTLRVNSDSTHRTEYKAGEKFDMNGLKITVIYDDYSTELADPSMLSLATGYDGALDEYNRYVVISGYGRTVQVAITVTPGNSDDDKKSGCGGGCGATSIGGSGASGLMALGAIGIAFAGIALTRRKRQNKAQ